MRILTAFAAAAAALAALITPSHADGPLGAKGDTLSMPLADALAALPAAGDDRAGYQRSAFKHWVDADRDGCNTRNEVLKAEAVTAPEQAAGCELSGGRWYSAYSNTYVDAPRGLDIDHLVSVAVTI
ncbi:hypothetical protein [Streptomyces sp. B3I8]|uniref:hypothetical protein n=1 Tax=Streptomyces sp. B3I8 TaxID=3042303 RepID=UPI00278207C5|nr:hypothetical protein [Streptomyces sp. B3I8]MDQ0784528.1 hypothetical protein [Streptomyces sp. B3I8]